MGQGRDTAMGRGLTRWRSGALAAAILAAAPAALAGDETADELARRLLAPDGVVRMLTLDSIRARGGTDLVAPLIEVLRYRPRSGSELAAILDSLTGERIGHDWHAWMLWQEAHPEIIPYDGYAGFKADVLALIDPAFRLFVHADVAHEIRLEEIVWGGVAKDGIPALIDPAHIPAAEASWLEDDEPVFGLALGGDVRAWPLRILDWHEMANDVVGGVPVALAYCTLCGSGILFRTGREDGGRWLFGSSGLLYRSNKLMYDQETHSLWNQFTGRPVVGPLTGSGIRLEVLPVAITSWGQWRERHPETLVLSLETGFERDYRPGRPYGDYFASPDLMFPARFADPRAPAKSFVFALRLGEAEKAWPLDAFAGGAVINDLIGDLEVVLVGEAASRTVRAYERGGQTFALAEDGTLRAGDVRFALTEAALEGEHGTRLARLPGHIAYRFAWWNFVPGGELAETE
jgi:hypothetical protein